MQLMTKTDSSKFLFILTFIVLLLSVSKSVASTPQAHISVQATVKKHNEHGLILPSNNGMVYDIKVKQVSFKDKIEKGIAHLKALGEGYGSIYYTEPDSKPKITPGIQIIPTYTGKGYKSNRKPFYFQDPEPFNVLIKCNFSKGTSKGSLKFSDLNILDRSERNHRKLNATCIPLTPKQKAQQIAKYKEKEHLIAIRLKKQRLAAQLKNEQEMRAAKKRALEERKAAEARSKEKARRSTPMYKRNAAKARIKELNSSLNAVNQELMRQDRIEQASGVENLGARWHLGAQKVNLEDLIQKQWNIYKANGGKASNSSSIR